MFSTIALCLTGTLLFVIAMALVALPLLELLGPLVLPRPFKTSFSDRWAEGRDNAIYTFDYSIKVIARVPKVIAGCLLSSFNFLVVVVLIGPALGFGMVLGALWSASDFIFHVVKVISAGVKADLSDKFFHTDLIKD